MLLIVVYFFGCQNNNDPLPSEWNMNVIPAVQEMTVLDGGIQINPTIEIQASEGLGQAKADLADLLNDETYAEPRYLNTDRTIRLDLTAYNYGLEGYELLVDQSGVVIRSNTTVGIQRGTATLKQLIWLNASEQGYFLPLVHIKDWSRFAHRGLLLDCSRHFFEVEVVMKYIDLLHLFKMNTLHWHLTEDQGWRIAIDAYPKLTEVGAWRTELDSSAYGGFYEKDDIRSVVAYAAQKGITVIPEIELPGHSQAAIAAYPHLSCTGDSIDVANDWGVFKEIYCAGNDSTFKFLETVLTEVMELFPSKQIHIGGDEVPKSRWDKCSKCQQRMVDEGLETEEELQSYFIQRIHAFLSANGRELIGWDEILEGGLSEGAIVQSWRGVDGGIEAVKHGHQAIMSPTSHAYFDYGLDAIDLKKVYAFNPIPKGLKDAEVSLILGGECNIWTEHVPDSKTLDQKVFPRLMAMAEVLWSDSSYRHYEEFNDRVQHFYPILDAMGVSYGQEAIPMTHVIHLDKSSAYIELIPYSDEIELKFQYQCVDCNPFWSAYSDMIQTIQSGTILIQPERNGRNYDEVIKIPVSTHKGINAEVTYEHPYSKWYRGGGVKGLVDSKLGTLNFRDGAWQGFWGTDLECVVELSEEMSITSVSANFYQYNNSWIFIPKEMAVEVSKDGQSWTSLQATLSDVDPKQRGKFIHTLAILSENTQAVKFVKLIVKNLGKVPDWHEAAGADSWIFIDEIQIK